MTTKDPKKTQAMTPVAPRAVPAASKNSEGDELVPVGDDAATLMLDVASFMQAIKLSGEEVEFEQTITLLDGQSLWAIEFIGPGADMEVGALKQKPNPETGEMGWRRDLMKTWMLRYDPGEGKAKLRIRLMGKHGINTFLSSVRKGDRVCILRQGTKEVSNGQRVNVYVTGVMRAGDESAVEVSSK